MNSYEKMKGLDVTLNQIVQQVADMNVKSTTSVDDETTGTTWKKIVGGVFPTEAQTQVATTVAATVAQTQAATSSTPVDVKPVLSYIVQKGDTLMSICRKIYGDGLKYKEIMGLNNIDDPDKIYIGQEIKLP